MGHGFSYLTAPAVIPLMKYLDMNKYRINMGSIAMDRPVKSKLQFVLCWPKNVESPTGRVFTLSDWRNTKGKKKSFQMGTAL
jgi:bifunctional pyridoxal-dependent enzyme with beta-cystathionase and maltose regulon repressor activities